jgi:hypothetical protein
VPCFCAQKLSPFSAVFLTFSSPAPAGLGSCSATEQAALPQGIVPFVFAKEYNVHPAILSTA